MGHILYQKCAFVPVPLQIWRDPSVHMTQRADLEHFLSKGYNAPNEMLQVFIFIIIITSLQWKL